MSLRSPEGDEEELALFENFFIAEIPADRVPRDSREGQAYEVVAKDSAGTELPPLAVTELSSRWREHFPKVTGPKRTVIKTTDSRGRPMTLSLVPIEGDEVSIEIKTRTGTRCSGARFAHQGINVHPTLMGSMVFFSGSVGPEVAKLELHHQDGTALELSIFDRFVLHDVRRARFEKGKRPILLVARGRDGVEVDRRRVNQKAYFGSSNLRSGGDVSP